MSTTRRTFLQNSTLGAAGISIVPRHVLGGPGYIAPSDQVNIALVGAGGRGKAGQGRGKRRRAMSWSGTRREARWRAVVCLVWSGNGRGRGNK